MSEEGKEPTGAENPEGQESPSNFAEDGTYKLNLAEAGKPEEEPAEEPAEEPSGSEEGGNEEPSEEPALVEIEEKEEEEGEGEEKEVEGGKTNPKPTAEEGEGEEKEEGEEAQADPSPQFSEEDISLMNEIKNLEGAKKLVDFMKETGGSVEDFVLLNTDFEKKDSLTLVKEHLRATRPNLSEEGINLLIEDSYSYDVPKDDDDYNEKEARKAKIAFEEAASTARQYFNELKDKYYDDVKLAQKVDPEVQDKLNQYEEALKKQEASKEQARLQAETFTNKTKELFNEDFKGFDFQVGDKKKFRMSVKDAQELANMQSNFMNVFGKYIDEKTQTLSDAKGYHKALYAAQNADKLARHFYEQGMADAIKDQNAKGKNIDMDGRPTADGKVASKSGDTYKVVGGVSSNRLSMKSKPKYE